MRLLLGIITFFFIISTCLADPPPAFVLNTNAFLPEGILPVLYTCDGKDISPQLDWANVPGKTQTFALTLVDNNITKEPFYHWILYNIPQKTINLEEGIKPTGMNVGKNNMGNQRYNGPCPPKGDLHHYTFTLYALDTKLSVPDGSDGKTVMEAMKNHILGKTELKLLYSRWRV